MKIIPKQWSLKLDQCDIVKSRSETLTIAVQQWTVSSISKGINAICFNTERRETNFNIQTF